MIYFILSYCHNLNHMQYFTFNQCFYNIEVVCNPPKSHFTYWTCSNIYCHKLLNQTHYETLIHKGATFFSWTKGDRGQFLLSSSPSFTIYSIIVYQKRSSIVKLYIKYMYYIFTWNLEQSWIQLKAGLDKKKCNLVIIW